jgi:predicted  nucleic acid-binding Zn-ribbon protein
MSNNQQIVIGATLKADATGAQQTVQQFRDKLREANAELVKAETEVQSLTAKFGATSPEVEQAKQKITELKESINNTKLSVFNLGNELANQLQDAQSNVAKLAQQFGATDQRTVEAAKHVATLFETLREATDEAKNINPDSQLASVAQLLGGVTDGVTQTKNALLAAETEVQELTEKFGATSPQVQEANARVNELKQSIVQATTSVEGFGNEGAQTVAEFRNQILQSKASLVEAEKEVEKLTKLFGATSPEVLAAKERVNELKDTIKQSQAGINGFGTSLKTQLKDAEAEVVRLAEAFGATDKRTIAAAKSAAVLRDKIGDAKNMIAAFNPDAKFAAFAQSLNGVVGGFTAIHGVMGLIGTQSEDVQKALLKVQSALALSQGLNQLQEAKDSFKTLGAIIKNSTVFVKANEVANKAAAFSMKLFGGSVETTSTSFKVLKGAIAATGIGLLVVAIGEAISWFQELSNAADKAAEKEKEALELRQKFADIGLKGEEASLARQESLAVARAKNANKSESEIRDIERMYQDLRIESLQRYLKEVGQDSEQGVEAQTRIKDLKAKIEVDDLNSLTEINKKKLDEEKKAQDKRDAEHKREVEKERQHQKELAEARAGLKGTNLGADAIEDFRKQQDEIAKRDKENFENAIAPFDKEIAYKIEKQVELTKAEDANAQARIRIAQEEHDAKVQFAYDLGNALGALSDLVGKQTAAGKSLAIAQATINTWTGATEVLRAPSVLPEPFGTASKIVNVAAIVASGLKSVKEILKVKVAGSAGGASVSGAGAPLSPAISNSVTALDPNSINAMNNQAVHAFVLESDVTNNQEKVKRINRAARLA